MDINKISIKSFLKIEQFPIQNLNSTNIAYSFTNFYVHRKFIVIGTSTGDIYVSDYLGNIIKKYNLFKNDISSISVSISGETFACCSSDGKIIVSTTLTDEIIIKMDSMCPIKSVAIHPYFEKKIPKSFVAGVSERLILYQKSWLKESPTVLHTGEGIIQSIKWQGQFLAWSSFLDVNIMDMEKKEWISHIAFNEKVQSLSNLHLFWKDNITLVIGHDNTFQICQVKKRKDNEAKNLPEYMAEIMNIYRFNECSLLGISNIEEKYIILLKKHSNNKMSFIELVSINMNDCKLFIDEECCSFMDNLSSSKAPIIHTDQQTNQNIHIMYADRIYVAQSKNDQDFIADLINQKKYKDALQIIDKNNITDSEYKRNVIAKKLIDQLFDSNELDFFFNNIAWINQLDLDNWVYSFEQLKSKNSINNLFIDSIPTNISDPNKLFYQNIIEYLIRKDRQSLVNVINNWHSQLYDVKKVYQILNDAVHLLPNDYFINSSLAKICIEIGDYKNSFLIQLKLKTTTIFEFIEQYKLHQEINNNLTNLFSIDPKKFVNLCSLCPTVIEPSTVVTFLSNDPVHLEQYLWFLHTNHPLMALSFSDIYIELSIKYSPENLMTFLKNSTSYDLTRAINLCSKTPNLQNEMIYLYERAGNFHKALEYIIKKKDGITEAIDFCLKYNESEIWEHLIEIAKNNAEFIKELLMNVGCYIDPVKLINKIPSFLSIKDLKDALAKIMHDYWTQIAIYESSKIIVDRDCLNLYNNLIKYNSSGLIIKESSRCSICMGSIVVEGSQYSQDVLLFYCGHIYHRDCSLRNSNNATKNTITCFECDQYNSKQKF